MSSIPTFSGDSFTVAPQQLSQVGIEPGSYECSATLIVGNQAYPWYDVDLDLNIYSASSRITAHVPQVVQDADGSAMRDFSQEAQKSSQYPWKLQIGYWAASIGPNPVAEFEIERGYIDETTDTYDANEVEIVGRSTAALFQDNILASPAPQSITGTQLASTIFAKRNVSLTIPNPASNYLGKAYSETEAMRAYRARTEWDEMQDAALADGYVLYVHRGQGYYGPPAADQNTPTIALQWKGAQGDLAELKVNHAARRSHDIQVRVDSQDRWQNKKVSATYGTAGKNGQQFLFYVGGLNRYQVRAKAKAIWLDLVKHEFVSTLCVVPDPQFMQMLATNGPNFLVSLGGDVKASHALLYHVKQATLKLSGGDTEEPSMVVELTCVNHAPVAGSEDYL